jgi:hypothetical protein
MMAVPVLPFPWLQCTATTRSADSYLCHNYILDIDTFRTRSEPKL